MVETKKITLGGEEYFVRCSILTTELFERTTGKKFSQLINNYQKLGKAMSNMDDDKIQEFVIDNIFDIELSAMQLAWCMIEEAKRDGKNKDFAKTTDQFISDLGTLSSNELKEVLAAAMSVFPRKL